MGFVRDGVDSDPRGRPVSKIAFCFPGQGSQRVGMGHELAAAFPASAQVFDQASATAGFDVAAVCADGPIEELSKTEVTQPALVAASLVALRAVQERFGTEPAVVVGHSVGEYAALAAAGSIGVADVTGLVRARGLATAASKAGGGMAAILKLSDEQVEGLCASRDDVWPANYNCPGQVVVSGRDGGLEAVASGCGRAWRQVHPPEGLRSVSQPADGRRRRGFCAGPRCSHVHAASDELHVNGLQRI